MSSITAQTVIGNAQTLLQDQANVRWPASTELLAWLNEGIAIAAATVFSASVRTVAPALIPGARQMIPSDGSRLLEIIRNEAGPTVTYVSRHVLDDFDPDWYSMPQTSEVIHYSSEDYEPKVFYVYPPNDGTGSVRMAYSSIPIPVTSLTALLPVDDEFAPALTNYIAYRALLKEDEGAADDSKSSAFLALFNNYLVSRAALDKTMRPR